MNNIDMSNKKYKKELALWFKEMEIEALNTSHNKSPIEGFFDYWQGKAQGFSQGWEYIVFDGRDVHPLEYNRANEKYSKILEDIQDENRESENNNR